MAKARRSTGNPPPPVNASTPELSWYDLEYWWAKDRVLREIQITPYEGSYLVGRTGQEFARLSPAPTDGVIMMHERDYHGREDGYPRYRVWTHEMLLCQLNLAASAARWRLRRKDAGWIKPRKQT